MTLEVLLDIDEEALAEADWLPSHDFLADWARHALAGVERHAAAGGAHGPEAAVPRADRSEGGTPETCRELSIRLAGQATMRALNRDWRGRDAPTNVLSFPSGMPTPVFAAPAEGVYAVSSPVLPLGDLAICPAVVQAEARAQDKSPEAHWAHMVVHGVLHLAGLDHEDEAEALVMERLESRLLSERAIPDPYGASGVLPS